MDLNSKGSESGFSISYTEFILIFVLAMMSGAFSGLNLGLLGLDVRNLELLTKGPFNNE